MNYISLFIQPEISLPGSKPLRGRKKLRRLPIRNDQGRPERSRAMFGWFKRNNGNAAGQKKLPGPRNLPDDIGRTLVVDHKQDPNWAWSLKAVLKPGEEKSVFLVRVFDDRAVSSQGVRVTDYNSFNERPDLVLFDGWFNKKTHTAQVTSHQKAA
jgi:hypothetical protein